ncbi:hypothetical protein ACP5PY_04160 [Photobacterium leiognathi subsp. mandapamensis]
MSEVNLDKLKAENEAYYLKLEDSLNSLFSMAKDSDELQFAFSLSPESRGSQDAGWNTAEDAIRAFDEYLEFIQDGPLTPIKARVALGFYCHLSEASGFYEVLKNMLRVADGEKFVMWPFQKLVQKHKASGSMIAPNANKVMRDLAGHAKEIGLDNLAECVRDAFDSDLRNGYAHADYIIWSDGIRLRKRNGGNPKLITWGEFNYKFERAVNFFNCLRDVTSNHIESYAEPKVIRSSLQPYEPQSDWTIHLDKEKGTFRISG